MRTSRLIAGLLSAGLLGLTPVAVSAPAGAATTYATQATLTPSATAVQ
ncbi:hypothetical protein [Nocardioides gansuensis]|nr:hypothetical protein [Nocardioides gansuensis]